MDNSSQIQVYRFEEFYGQDTINERTEGLHRLFWLEDGRGMQFIHAGKRYAIKQYRQSGWVIIFSDFFYRTFLNHYPHYQNCLLFEPSTRMAFIEISNNLIKEIDKIAFSLQEAVRNAKSHLCIQPFLDLLLLYAGDAYGKGHNISLNTHQAEKFRKLHSLIRKNYKSLAKTEEYAKELKIGSREINAICKQITGRNVRQEINAQRIAEAQSQLILSSKSVKEIALELGYDNQALFTVFFKKKKGMSPSAYRRLGLYGTDKDNKE